VAGATERAPAAGKRQRVPALAPHERRAALIVATIPLLQKYGIDISTRQIADAAGVAEGTIFAVFRDKASLIDAAVAAAFDPATVIRRLRDIDPGLDLRGRMAAAVQVLREYIAEQGLLLHVVRGAVVKGERASSRVDVMAARYLILYELANLIEPDAARLRRNASTAPACCCRWPWRRATGSAISAPSTATRWSRSFSTACLSATRNRVSTNSSTTGGTSLADPTTPYLPAPLPP
jgi:AcrR family transcriptional regulator